MSYLDSLSKQHDRLEDKIDAIIIKQNDIHVQVTRNTDSLIEHMRRTQLAEKRIEHVEKHIIRIDKVIDILSPTKTKLIILLIASAFAFGVIDFNSKDPIIKQVIQLIK